MYNLSIVETVTKPFGDKTYRWVLTKRVGDKVISVARGSHGYRRKQDAVRAFQNLGKLFDGTLMYTKNY